MEELEIYDTVTLASGKAFNCDYLATIPTGYMFISVISENAGELLASFVQHEETARITYGDHILENYVFVGIQQEAQNRYKVMLRKAFVGEA